MRRLLLAAADAQLRGFATLAAPGPRVAVVGGGVAGLAAAKELVNHGVACTLLDMGDGGVGGRLSSQQAQPKSAGQPLSFDHGAQLFLATAPDFQTEVASWAAAGVAQQWRGRHGRITKDYTFEPRQSSGDDGSSSGSSGGDGGSGASKGSQPRWVGVPSNGAIPAHMARQLAAQHPSSFQLQSGCAVQSMERLGGGCGSPTRWRLHGSLAGQEPAELGDYDAVILADAAPLLPGSPGYVEGLEAASSSLAQLARSVQAVSYQPRFTLTVAFAAPLPGVPFDFASVEDSGGARACGSCGCGACGSISGGAFQGVACNSSKPGRPGSGSDTSSSSGGGSADGPQCWVGVSTAQRAQQLVEQLSSRYDPQSEQYYAAVAEELLADFRDIMAPFVQGFAVPQPIYCRAHWWGRAFVNEPLGSEFLLLPAQRLALCGDVALGSGVEKAWRSGRAAGEAVGRMLAPGTAS